MLTSEIYPVLEVALKLARKFCTQDREGINILSNFHQEVTSQKKQKYHWHSTRTHSEKLSPGLASRQAGKYVFLHYQPIFKADREKLITLSLNHKSLQYKLLSVEACKAHVERERNMMPFAGLGWARP